MKLELRKTIFFIFVFITFLAGWYFYVMNPTTPFIENLNDIQSVVPGLAYDISGDPVEIQDSNDDNPNYNQNMYNGFDPTSQYVGMYTNLDKIHQSTSFSELSDNAMDANWGGVLYTEEIVNSGKYDENLVVPYGYNPELGTGISTRIQLKEDV